MTLPPTRKSRSGDDTRQEALPFGVTVEPAVLTRLQTADRVLGSLLFALGLPLEINGKQEDIDMLNGALTEARTGAYEVDRDALALEQRRLHEQR